MDGLVHPDRRTFMRRGAMGAGALWMLSLQELSARGGHRGPVVINGVSPYGPVLPTKDETTGLELLKLPEGFRYWSYSWTGDPLSDGVVCPNLHDGMAVVEKFRDRENDEVEGWFKEDGRWQHGRRRSRGDEKLVLVRNHEGGVGAPYLGNRPDLTYAPVGVRTGAGGTTNLVFNVTKGKFESAVSSLAGTIRNCAGGVTPWGTWLTCEETDEAGHGWTFEVGSDGGSTTPLTDLGRFSHEADMIDPGTGIVYETEDAGNSGFYKFLPHRLAHLEKGGRLYMLAIRNSPNIDLGVSLPIGAKYDVVWVRIDDPTAATESCYAQGAAKGGARFSRLEGAWWGDRTGYFLSTNGGSVGEGQVFEYDPKEETLTVIYDAPNATDVDNPDNITVTPRGGLLLCEDAAGNHFTEGERLVGLTLHGQTFTFAMNNIVLAGNYNAVVRAGDYRQNEWAGACYSPDGKWLFANIQTPGLTFAITGPWGEGPL
jgi:secreted PhoX family phosphatase